MPEVNRWEVLKVIRNEFDQYGKAQAVQIRWCRTENGNLTFAYSTGISIQGANQDGSDGWRLFKYIPDRYILDYIQLITEASSLVRLAMSNSERDSEGRVTASLLESSVVSSIKRRRSPRSTVEG